MRRRVVRSRVEQPPPPRACHMAASRVCRRASLHRTMRCSTTTCCCMSAPRGLGLGHDASDAPHRPIEASSFVRTSFSLSPSPSLEKELQYTTYHADKLPFLVESLKMQFERGPAARILFIFFQASVGSDFFSKTRQEGAGQAPSGSSLGRRKNHVRSPPYATLLAAEGRKIGSTNKLDA